MDTIAPDILDLAKKLEDGEGDEVLNNRAIEIYERLTDEFDRAKSRGSKSDVDAVMRQGDHFHEIIEKIKARRHDHVLDEFYHRVEELKM